MNTPWNLWPSDCFGGRVMFRFFGMRPFLPTGRSNLRTSGRTRAVSGIVPLAESRYPGITCLKHDIRLARTGAIYADRLQNVYDGVCLDQDTLQLHSGDVADAAFDSVVLSSSIAVKFAGGYDCDFQSTGLSPSRIKGSLTIEKGTVEIAAVQIEGGDSEGNTAPVADAGSDQTVSVGNTATLNAGGSSDPDGDPLTFSWTLEKPAGSQATLSDPLAVCPQFTVDLAGEYVCELTVNDGLVDSAPDQVTIDTENSLPVAVIQLNPDETLAIAQQVALDGTASYDFDDDSLTHAWTLIQKPEGSSAELTDPGQATAYLTPDVAGDYTIQLVVNDIYGDSEPAQRTVGTGNNDGRSPR